MDGANITLEDGSRASCCKGEWVTVVDLQPTECWQRCSINSHFMDFIQVEITEAINLRKIITSNVFKGNNPDTDIAYLDCKRACDR